MSDPPPLPPEVPLIPYATPAQYYAPMGVSREGNLIVLPRDTALPPRCVKCNEPRALQFASDKTLYWHHPALFLLILFPGLVIYMIVAFIVRKSTSTRAFLCEKHLRQRRTNILIGAVIATVGLALLFGSIVVSVDDDFHRYRDLPPMLFLGGLGVLIIALIWAVATVRMVRAKKIDDRYVWLAGAGPEFLDSLAQTGQYVQWPADIHRPQ
jgi:hypothetical protein